MNLKSYAYAIEAKLKRPLTKDERQKVITFHDEGVNTLNAARRLLKLADKHKPKGDTHADQDPEVR